MNIAYAHSLLVQAVYLCHEHKTTKNAERLSRKILKSRALLSVLLMISSMIVLGMPKRNVIPQLVYIQVVAFILIQPTLGFWSRYVLRKKPRMPYEHVEAYACDWAQEFEELDDICQEEAVKLLEAVSFLDEYQVYYCLRTIESSIYLLPLEDWSFTKLVRKTFT